MNMIQIKRQNQPDAPWKTITPEELAEYCVEITGGGYNEQQTARGMELQREILALPEGTTWKSAAGILEIRLVTVQFKVEVRTNYKDPKWYGNAKVYDTFSSCKMGAIDLAMRWMLVVQARVVEFYQDHGTIEVINTTVVFGE